MLGPPTHCRQSAALFMITVVASIAIRFYNGFFFPRRRCREINTTQIAAMQNCPPQNLLLRIYFEAPVLRLSHWAENQPCGHPMREPLSMPRNTQQGDIDLLSVPENIVVLEVHPFSSMAIARTGKKSVWSISRIYFLDGVSKVGYVSKLKVLMLMVIFMLMIMLMFT